VDGSGRVNGRKVAHPRKEDGTINVDGGGIIGGRVKGRKVAHPRKEDVGAATEMIVNTPSSVELVTELALVGKETATCQSDVTGHSY
jgi:hypothetical protein